MCLPVPLLGTDPAKGLLHVDVAEHDWWARWWGQGCLGRRRLPPSPSAIAAHFQAPPPSPWTRCWWIAAAAVVCCRPPLHHPIAKFFPRATRRHVNRQIPFTVEREPHNLVLAAKKAALQNCLHHCFPPLARCSFRGLYKGSTELCAARTSLVSRIFLVDRIHEHVRFAGLCSNFCWIWEERAACIMIFVRYFPVCEKIRNLHVVLSGNPFEVAEELLQSRALSVSTAS